MAIYETEKFCISDEEIQKLIKLEGDILNFCKTIPNDQKLGEIIRQYYLKKLNK